MEQSIQQKHAAMRDVPTEPSKEEFAFGTGQGANHAHERKHKLCQEGWGKDKREDLFAV